ncbi:Inositol-pentakisphosphate 2-kinase-like protein [Dinothrombium tinctorium]|uniref:Inositol-pentakisphosphate 2-kinase n=1 Tax=Dinothrombium tinctorium TaxID=1965070 RepID=A0A443QQJ5_9ACAR|nr:Inositol-pentakisphosphate 2-kinase-like protein [Dinothrombium tinctorium]
MESNHNNDWTAAELVYRGEGNSSIVIAVKKVCFDQFRKVKLFRKHKSLPDEDTFALLMPDFCDIPQTIATNDNLIGPVISVEIKPKQGFLSSLDPYSCVYSSFQSVKLEQGLITRKSGYCPLDLYSGCRHRMNIALNQLLSNPQNNFRIFRDLQLAYGEGLKCDIDTILHGFINVTETIGSIKDVFCNLLIEALLKPFHNKNEILYSKLKMKYEQHYCNYHRDISLPCECKEKCQLPYDCILGTILRTQMLDTIDHRFAQDLLDFILKCSSDIEKFSELTVPRGVGSISKLDFESNELFMTRKIWEFLVSLTAKDCSIIIAMQKLNSAEIEFNSDTEDAVTIIHVPQARSRFFVRLSIIDVDQKPFHKVYKLKNFKNIKI